VPQPKPNADAEELEVTPAEVAEALDGEPPADVIDVREGYEREAGHIDGSRHVELVQLAAAAGTIDRERPVYVYCRVGARSRMAVQALRAAGFQAYSMQGGLLRWAQEERPLSPEGGSVAKH
jgi:rhodanese-related sulfurtransferase